MRGTGRQALGHWAHAEHSLGDEPERVIRVPRDTAVKQPCTT
ncbi:hypothetical protein STXM2123_1402 [Streptomyces sp. F-3]|nr:hypothetical protein STXM2123_1402 [Streptomyces sp. F-3]